MEVLDKTKELETKDIGHLLWIYALPSVISQIIASVYNIVDRIFIGHGVGALAIAGLAIIAALSNFTAMQRLLYIKKHLEKETEPKQTGESDD